MSKLSCITCLLWSVLALLQQSPALVHAAAALSNPPNPNENETSRRHVLSNGWKTGLGIVGAVAYGTIVKNALGRVISLQAMDYPPEHTRRVARTIHDTLHLARVERSLSLLPSSLPSSIQQQQLLRVLEVGIGQDCRLIRSGLYNDAFDALATMGVTRIELVGMDLVRPKEASIQKAMDYLNERQRDSPLQVDLTIMEGDITQLSSSLLLLSTPRSTTLPQRLPLSFDAVISCLTLCSVQDQELAVASIRDSLRPRGGCLGYIEHVAVNPTEPYKFLEWQQQTLDPLQQALADNCHLHRYTEQTIARVFGIDTHRAALVSEERFLVDSMWPVTCQACGIVQRIV